MIKIFRKIRQNLLMENKTSKYFKYALGEILLVMIGILLALQINNWNENRKELFNQNKILKTLNAEFIENKITLDSTLVLLNNISNSLGFVLKNTQEKPKINLSTSQLDSVLLLTISNPYWKKSEYTLRNLENSGKLSTLSNENLKKKLYEYSHAITDVNDKDADATIAFNHLLEYYKANGSLRNMDETGGNYITEGRTLLKYDHVKFFSDIVFENAIDDCLVYVRQRIERYTKAKAIIENVIKITGNNND
jgi:hypothetical protein